MKYQTYEKIKSLSDLKQRIKQDPENILPVAGATDIMVKARTKDWYRAMDLVDIVEIPELKGIWEEKDNIKVGSLTTASEILDSSIIRCYAKVLADSCESLAGPQIRNRATIGGNLANACLAGDMIPALCVLGAQLLTISGEGERCIPAEQLLKRCPACLNHEEMSVAGCFFGAPAGKKTILKSGEIITYILIPKSFSKYQTVFQKIGRKRSGCMSRFTLAIAMQLEGDVISDLRISIGAAFADIGLLKEGASLVGQEGSEEVFTRIGALIGDQIEAQSKRPNDSIKYKAEVCRRLLPRTMMELYLNEKIDE